MLLLVLCSIDLCAIERNGCFGVCLVEWGVEICQMEWAFYH